MMNNMIVTGKILTGLMILLILLMRLTTNAQQPNVYISGSVTEGPSGFPVADQTVFFTITLGNDSLISLTESVVTNDSGYYSFATHIIVSFARVDISTPDCNGTMLSEVLFVTPGNSYSVDLEICAIEICQAFFTYEQISALSYQFADQSTGSGLNFFWDFGDNTTSALQNPVHDYQQPGIYEVCLYIFTGDSTCFDAYCNIVVAGNSGGCVAQFSYYPDSSQSSYSVQFIDLSYGDITSWSWDFGDGTISGEPNPLHTYPSGGEYLVCLTVSGPECQSTWCAPVLVTMAGDCFNYFTHQSSGQSVVFTGFHSTNLPASFWWDFGDGVSGEGETVIHEYSSTGTYYVTLNTVDENNCMASSSQAIVVGDTIIFNQVYGQVMAGDFPISIGQVIISSVESIPGFNPFYQEVSVDPSGIFIFPYVPNGSYVLYAIPDEDSGYLPAYYGDAMHWGDAVQLSLLGAWSDPYLINLAPSLANMLTGTGSIAGTINEPGYISGRVDQIRVLLYNEFYKPLKFSDVSPSGGFAFNGLEHGTYYLYPELPGVASSFLRADISEASQSLLVTLSFSGNSILGTEESVPVVSVGQVWPNPVTETARLSVNIPKPGKVTVWITDLAGRAVHSFELWSDAGELIIEVPVSHLKPGVFLINVHLENGPSVTRKFVRR